MNARALHTGRCGGPLLLLAVGAALWRGGTPTPGAPAVVPGLGPHCLATAHGCVYVWDGMGSCSVWCVRPGRKPEFLDGSYPSALNLSSDSGPPVYQVLFSSAAPLGSAFDRHGNQYACDFGLHRVRRVATDGTTTIVAGTGRGGDSGDGIPALTAQLGMPEGVVVDADGNLYIADWGNGRVRKVDRRGLIWTVAARSRLRR